MTQRTCALVFVPAVLAACSTTKTPSDPPVDSGTPTLAECPDGEVDASGTCVPAACGDTNWPQITGVTTTHHVDPGATESGDGTQAAPWSTVAEALAAASPGDGIAIGAGTLTERLILDDTHHNLTIVARCPQLTTWDGDATPTAQAVLTAEGATGITVRGITIHGGDQGGVWATGGAELTLEDVWLDGASRHGLLANDPGTVLHFSNGAIANIQGDLSLDEGVGAGAYSGATLQLEAVAVTDTAGMGLQSSGRYTRVEATDVTVQRAGADTRDGFMAGVVVDTEAALDSRGLVVEEALRIGVLVTSDGSAWRSDQDRVADTRGVAGEVSAGVWVGSGADAHTVDLVVEDNHHNNLLVAGRGSTLTASGGRSGQDDGDPDGSWGLQAAAGAWAEVTGMAFDGHIGLAMYLNDEDTVVELNDVQITETWPRSDGAGGGAIELLGGATLRTTNLIIEDSLEYGILAGTDTSLSMTGGTVRGIRPSSATSSGTGVWVQNGATAQLTDVLLESNTGVGLGASSGSTVQATGVEVTDTILPSGWRAAAAVLAQGDSQLIASNLSIQHTQGAALYAIDTHTLVSCDGCVIDDSEFAGVVVFDAQVSVTDSTIENTRSHAYLGGGIGAFIRDRRGPGSLTITGSDIGPHPVSGVWCEGLGACTLANTHIDGGTGFAVSGEGIVHGNGVVVTGASITHSDPPVPTFEGVTFTSGHGPSLLLHRSTASLTGLTLSDDDLQWLACDGVDPLLVDGMPDETRTCDDTAYVLSGLDFGLN